MAHHRHDADLHQATHVAHNPHDDHQPHGHHITPVRTLVAVLLILLALTALTVYTAKNWQLGLIGNASLAVFIATVKATIVCMYFMHLKHDNHLYTLAMLTCVGGVVLFLGFSMGDLGTRHLVDPTRATLLTPVPQDMVRRARIAGDELAVQGAPLFVANCAACHGVNARGVQGLGPGILVREGRHDYVLAPLTRSMSDLQLVQYLKDGVPNRGKPPLAGNPNLTDESLLKIVRYVRTLQSSHGHGGKGGHADEPHADQPAAAPAH